MDGYGMNDWRARATKKLADIKEAEDKKRKEEEERRKREEERLDREREAQRYADTYGRLAKCKCHVCGVQAKIPEPGSGGYTDEFGNYFGSSTNWYIPGDLKKCSICDRWTCKDHYLSDGNTRICQHCA